MKILEKIIIDKDVWTLTVLEILIFLHYSSLIKYIFSKKKSQTYLFIQVHILLYTLRRCSSFEHWNDFH